MKADNLNFEISNIQFKNGTSKWDVKGKVKKAYVEFDLPFGIPVISMSQRIVMNDFECILTISHFHPDPTSSKSARFKGKTFYENDRWGKSFLTHIQIRFDNEPPIDLYPKYNDEIFEKSIRTVNRFLKVSRLILQSFFMNHIILEDIDQYNTTLFDENDQKITGGIIGMNPGELKTVVGGFKITDDEKNTIINYLENNTEIPISDLLLKNSQDYLFLENYRAALIECEAAFEIAVAKILYLGFTTNGDTAHEAETKIECSGFANLLKDHLDRFLRTPFYGSNEYSKWKTDCYDKRNKLVHAGIMPATNEIQDAISSVQQAINFFNREKTV